MQWWKETYLLIVSMSLDGAIWIYECDYFQGGLPRAADARLELVPVDITQRQTLAPEFFEGVRALLICSAPIVNPKEGDSPDRAKYMQARIGYCSIICSWTKYLFTIIRFLVSCVKCKLCFLLVISMMQFSAFVNAGNQVLRPWDYWRHARNCWFQWYCKPFGKSRGTSWETWWSKYTQSRDGLWRIGKLGLTGRCCHGWLFCQFHRSGKSSRPSWGQCCSVQVRAPLFIACRRCFRFVSMRSQWSISNTAEMCVSEICTICTCSTFADTYNAQYADQYFEIIHYGIGTGFWELPNGSMIHVLFDLYRSPVISKLLPMWCI